MNKIIIISLSLLGTYNLSAQSIQRSVIGSAGKILNGGSYFISQTIGEVATSRYAAANGTSLRQGFQQPFIVSAVLPVTWLSFTVSRQSEMEAVLHWKLASETNCKGFYIERMQDGENEFVTIDFVETNTINGNSSKETQYVYNGTRFYNKQSLYRIRQEDVDGTITYSEVKMHTGANDQSIKMNIWPIPAHTKINILPQGIGQNAKVLITDMQGKVVRTIAVENQNKIEIEGLPVGTYMVQLADKKTISQKILIL